MALDGASRDEDALLLARYASGDREAARILLARLTPPVLNLARHLLGRPDDAEDVVQEAMLRLWKMAPDWDPGRARVSTWLYRVVLNLCTDRHRRDRSVALPEGWDAADDSPGAAVRLQQKARAAALRAALQALPERQREAIVLREFQGLPNPEIAQIMGVSVEAVESLSARGRRALKAALRGRKEELGFTDD